MAIQRNSNYFETDICFLHLKAIHSLRSFINLEYEREIFRDEFEKVIKCSCKIGILGKKLNVYLLFQNDCFLTNQLSLA